MIQSMKDDEKEIKEEKKKDEKFKAFSSHKEAFVEEFVVDKHDALATDEELIDEVERKIKRNKEKFGTWFTVAMFILNILVLLIALYLQSKIFGVEKIESLVTIEHSVKYIIFGLLVCISLMLLEMLQVYVLLFKAMKKSHPFISYKCAAMGKYYGSLFGMATGGKTYQMFYLNSKGFSAGVSTGVPVVSYTLYQFVFAVVSFVVLLTSFSFVALERSTAMLVLSIISLILTFFMIIIILLMSFSKKLAPAIMIWIVTALKKMKFIKSKRAGINHGRKILEEYRRTMKYLLGNFTTMFVSILVNVATIVLTAMLPYLIYCIFYVPTSTTFIEIFAKVIICNLAMKYIPLPGGVGIAELSFTVLFSNMFTGGTLFWAMLFWRILGGYIYILQGIVFMVYGFISGRIKSRKKEKKQ